MPKPTLSKECIRTLLLPYASAEVLTPLLIDQLSTFLALLLRWNGRTNLSAIRDPTAIVQRHFGESLFAATHLTPLGTLLDFGSGAGFPGIPIQLVHPQRKITLAESQGKKAAFLSEVGRVLGLPCHVWPKRVEALPPGTHFDVVALRAVDKMEEALRAAAKLSTHLCVLSGVGGCSRWSEAGSFDVVSFPIPNSAQTTLLLARKRAHFECST